MLTVDRLLFEDELSSLALSEFSSRTKNLLSDPVWEIWLSDKDETITYSFENLSPYYELLTKLLLTPFEANLSYRVTADGEIIYTSSTWGAQERWVRTVVLGLLASMFGDRKVSELSDEETWEWYKQIVVSDRYNATKKFKNGIRSYGNLGRIHQVLAYWERCYKAGYIFDGPKFVPDKDYFLGKFIYEIVENDGLDTDLVEWASSYKREAVPIELATAILAYCMEVFESDEYKWARITLEAKLDLTSVNTKHVLRDLKNKEAYFEHARMYAGAAKSNDLRAKIALACDKAKQMFNASDAMDLPAFPEDWLKNHGINKFIAKVFAAASVTLYILTGARKNEIRSITKKSLSRDTRGYFQFVSQDNKGNKGIGAVRSICELGATAIDRVLALRDYLIREDHDKYPLLARRTYEIKNNPKRKYYITEALSLNFIKSNLFPDFSKEYGFELDDLDSITSHRFRHTWAEFAQRRFDGNVKEFIRIHFMHSFDSYFTSTYTQSKVFEEDNYQLNRNYLVEIMGRYVDGKEDLFGHMGQWIKRKIKALEFVSVHELSKIADEIKGPLEAHEYGFCIIRDDTETQSQCWDKGSLTAKMDAACWSKCGSCVHRLTLQNQRENIVRIGQSIQASIQSFESLGVPAITDGYKRTLKLAETALMEIDGEEKIDV